MKAALALLILPGILLVCLLGLLAAGCGLTRLDNWCARQLTDTDGQPEKSEIGNRKSETILPRAAAEPCADTNKQTTQ